MTRKEYWDEIRKRSHKLAVERARRFGFWVAPTCSLLLFLVWLVFPDGAPVVARLIGYAALLSFLVFVGEFFRAYFVQAPYDLHLETLAKIPNVDRAVIRDRLGQLLTEGEYVRKEAEYSGVNNFAGEILAWKKATERFLAVDLGKPYIARFANAVNIDERMIYSGETQMDVVKALKNGCNLLNDLIKEFA